MTVTIAVLGKSGNGKTTLTKALLTNLHQMNPGKSILMIDNDLSCQLGSAFGIDVKETINDIRCGKYEYKSKLPDNIPRHEFIEWAIQDLLINIYKEIDLIASGLIPVKNCLFFMQDQINDALVRLIKDYDFVLFDCEYDLPYLNQLVDYPIDVSLIVSDTSIDSVYASTKIKSSSANIASPGQIGIILNKVKNRKIPDNVSQILKESDLNILGVIPYDNKIEENPILKSSDTILESAKELLFRLNLPLI